MAEYTGWKPALTAALSKVGETIAVEQITLTAPMTYTLPEGTPSGIAHSVVFTQNNVGGHTVTYGGNAVAVETAAGSQTLVEVWPNGEAVVIGAAVAWADVTGKPATFAPTAHKASHKTGGTDVLTPADIGAQPAGSYATAAQGAKADTALQTATAQPINAQTGTTYTLQASDAGKLVTLTNSAAITLTIPGNVFTTGQRADCLVLGAGMVTAVGSSCTVNGTPSLVSRGQWSAFTVLFTSATTAVVVGDLASS